MKYLVTGATGFVGPYLVKRLVRSGHQVRCLVRKNSDTDPIRLQKTEIIRGDITVPETLRGIAEGVETVVHMATLGHMANFSSRESDFNQVNVHGTQNLIEESLRAGVRRFIHCSTVAAMGICGDGPADEETPCHPHHAYGQSKQKAEKRVLQAVHEQQLPAVILRFSMVYGPGDPRDLLMLTRLAKKRFFPVIGHRPKLTPLVHALDVVEGIIRAVEGARSGEIYILTNPEPMPFDQLRKIIQDALGIRGISLYVPEWMALGGAALLETAFRMTGKKPPVTRKNIESTLADRVFSPAKAMRDFGFSPTVDPVEGVRETVRWYMEKGWV